MKTRSLALPGILSILVIATIPILFAAVQSYVWNFYYFIIIAAFLTLMWQKKAGPGHDLIVRAHPSVIVFFVWAVIMCFPLPDGIISIISPKRFETLKSALNLNWTRTNMAFHKLFIKEIICMDRFSFELVVILFNLTILLH